MISRPWKALLGVAREVKTALERPVNDFSWSGWEGAGEALAELDPILAGLRRKDVAAARALRVVLLVTGPVCEVAAASAWSEEWLDLARRCDAALSRVGA